MSEDGKVSYGTRGRAEPHNSSIYKAFLSRLGLNTSHLADLKRRGLSSEHISNAAYGSKAMIQSKDMSNAISFMENNFNLDLVPGFYINDKGSRACAAVHGMVIPCRDIDGNVSSLLIRNDGAKKNIKTGRLDNKYVNFSSAGKTKGGKVFQNTHCPMTRGAFKAHAGTAIRITEGVLKADIANALGELPCVGVQGLNVRPDFEIILEECEISVAHIALDMGEDDNIDMIRARGNIISRLRKFGIDIKFEFWDVQYGKGIDDVLAGGNADKIRIATEEEVEAILAKANIKDANNGEWVYVIDQEKFFNIHTFQDLKKSQMADKFCMIKVEEVNKMIAAGFRQVDGLTYEPGKDIFIIRDGREYLNRWREGDVIPAPGNVDMLLEHMRYLFPEEEDGQLNIVLDYLAFILQFPGRKIRWMLLIQGDEGTGKSFIGELMKYLLGRSNVVSPTMEIIQDKYTDWQANHSLIIIEEMMASGKWDLMNKLKPFITNPDTTVRGMYMKAYEQPNRYNFLAYTNYADPIVIDDKDRRYGIVKTGAVKQDKDYYDKLFAWLEVAENKSAALDWFLKRDISAMNYNHAPMTAAKKEIIDQSRSQLEAFIIDNTVDRAWPLSVDVGSIRHWKGSKDGCPKGLEKWHNIKWAKALEKAGWEKYPARVRISDDSLVTLWLNPNKKEILRNLDHTAIAKRFDPSSLHNEPGGTVRPFESMQPI